MRNSTQKKTESIAGSLAGKDGRPLVRVKIDITVESLNVTDSDGAMAGTTPIEAAKRILAGL